MRLCTDNTEGSKAEGWVIVRSLEPFSCQAVSEMIASGTDYVGARRFREGATKKGLDGSLTDDCSVETRWWSALCWRSWT